MWKTGVLAVSLWMPPILSTLPDAAAADVRCMGYTQRPRLPASTVACDKRLSFMRMMRLERRHRRLDAMVLLPVGFAETVAPAAVLCVP
jgi:hypothetical protein